jgi:hypothetical protein
MYAYGDPTWTGNETHLGRRIVTAIEPDAEWPRMWRARIGSSPTDMANRTRAKDAAVCLLFLLLTQSFKVRRAPRIGRNKAAIYLLRSWQRHPKRTGTDKPW